MRRLAQRMNDEPWRRAMRVYAPWDEANSKQALKTRKWQAEFFMYLNANTKEIESQKLSEYFCL